VNVQFSNGITRQVKDIAGDLQTFTAVNSQVAKGTEKAAGFPLPISS
jgi:hypothetical protein